MHNNIRACTYTQLVTHWPGKQYSAGHDNTLSRTTTSDGDTAFQWGKSMFSHKPNDNENTIKH